MTVPPQQPPGPPPPPGPAGSGPPPPMPGQPPAATGPPAGGSRGAVIAIVATGGGLFLIAAMVVAFVVFTGGGPDDREILLEPIGHAGPNPFSPSASPEPDAALTAFSEHGPPEPADETVAASRPDPAAALEQRNGQLVISGDAAGLFGSPGPAGACDPEVIATHLAADASRADAWAGVFGIDASEIPLMLDTLTAVFLGADTRVVNHVFDDGDAIPYHAVLQRGTAVLIDTQGTPRVRCASGSPLAEPTGDPDGAEFTGQAWGTFSPDTVIVVESAPEPAESFATINVESGEPEEVAAGTSGTDSDASEPDDDAAMAAPDGARFCLTLTAAHGDHAGEQYDVFEFGDVLTQANPDDMSPGGCAPDTRTQARWYLNGFVGSVWLTDDTRYGTCTPGGHPEVPDEVTPVATCVGYGLGVYGEIADDSGLYFVPAEGTEPAGQATDADDPFGDPTVTYASPADQDRCDRGDPSDPNRVEVEGMVFPVVILDHSLADDDFDCMRVISEAHFHVEAYLAGDDGPNCEPLDGLETGEPVQCEHPSWNFEYLIYPPDQAG